MTQHCVYIFFLAENCIGDQESFDLLNEEVLKEMVPRVGLRLKFLSHFKQYKSEVLANIFQ